MLTKKVSGLIVSFLLIFISACNLPTGTGVPSRPGPAQGGGDAAQQTQAAVMLTSTAAAAAIAMTATQAALPSNTPTFTFTPSLTPTITFTLTPTTPMVSVSVETNCRSGPGTVYDALGVLHVGETAQVVGKGADGGYWIIQLPKNPAVKCWLWDNYATVTGNTDGLAKFSAPPTPTPTASPTPPAQFDVIYSSTATCGLLYRFKFRITNNGSVTWESDRVVVTDQTTSQTTSVDRNDFPLFDTCIAVSADQNLEHGEVGITTSAIFNANPVGHNITATLRLCSQDGMTGTCVEKTINFTP